MSRETIVAESRQYVPVPVVLKGGRGPTVLSDLPVECAVLPDGTRPAEVDPAWHPGVWLEPNVAAILVGPGTVTGQLPVGGDFRGWARFSTAGGERVVVYTENTLRVI